MSKFERLGIVALFLYGETALVKIVLELCVIGALVCIVMGIIG